MKKLKLHIIILSLISFLFFEGFDANSQTSIETTAKAQVSSWGTSNFGDEFKSQLGGRIIPSLSFDKTFESKIKIDAEVSMNTTGFINFIDWEQDQAGEGFQPYRMWLRLSAEKWEIRGGLQKINFGSANMLRPLMWFDQLDPRDPLQLTNGVYGLLGRYYFKNNANLWLWTLYGNENPRGWDIIGSDYNKPEYGGRYQFPFLKGEIAASYNFRKALSTNSQIEWRDKAIRTFPEHKFGIDGKWDLEIGFWLESSLTHYESMVLIDPNTFLNNIGADYTIGLGNGLNVIYEQLFYTIADKNYKGQFTYVFSIVSASYPLGLLDNVAVIAYYNWKNGDWYRFINFNRNYDNWSFYVMAFWNPETFALYNMNDNNNLFVGKGFQIMAVYNF